MPPGNTLPSGCCIDLQIGSQFHAALLNSEGVATFAPISDLSLGSHPVTASFGPSPPFLSSSASMVQIVDPNATAVTVTSSANPVQFGVPFELRATVTGAAPSSSVPTGTVAFTADGAPSCQGALQAGATACAVSGLLAPGAHQIAGTYSGRRLRPQYRHRRRADHSGLDDNGGRGHPRTPVRLRAADPVPGRCPAGNRRRRRTDRHRAVRARRRPPRRAGECGRRPLRHVHSRPGRRWHAHRQRRLFRRLDFLSSIATTTYLVVAAPTKTTVTASPEPSVVGQPVSLTATVSSAAVLQPVTGQVRFQVDRVEIGGPVPLTDGTAASPPITTIRPGDHTVTATYLPDNDFATSSGSATHTVNQPTSTILAPSQDPSRVGTPVTVIGHVGPSGAAQLATARLGTSEPITITGALTFSLDGRAIASCLAESVHDGLATCQLPELNTGRHEVTADYSGATFLEPSRGTLGLTVDDDPPAPPPDPPLPPVPPTPPTPPAPPLPPAQPGTPQPSGLVGSLLPFTGMDVLRQLILGGGLLTGGAASLSGRGSSATRGSLTQMSA